MNKEILDKIDENTFVISDTHIGHKNILEFEPGRLTQMRIEGYEADEHDKWIIDNWNETIKENDEVLVLGDFAFNGVQNYIQKLNGNITFIMGNHDSSPAGEKWKDSAVLRGVWIDIDDYNGYVTRIYDDYVFKDKLISALIRDINEVRYLFCHYDIFSSDDWDRKNKKIGPRIEYFRKLFEDFNCDKLVHGHVHSLDSANKEKSINVCMEHIGFKPKKLGYLL